MLAAPGDMRMMKVALVYVLNITTNLHFHHTVVADEAALTADRCLPKELLLRARPIYSHVLT